MEEKMFETIYSKNIYKDIEKAKKLASTDPDQAIAMSRKIYRRANKENLKIEMAHCLLNIALAGRNKSETGLILENSYEALSIFKKENNITGQSRSLNFIGIAYFYSSMYDEALKSFLEGKELLAIDDEDQLMVSLLNNIGEVYKESELYDKAIEHYNRAIEIVNRSSNSLSHAVILCNIGEILLNKRKYEEALEVYNKSHSILLETDEIVSLADTENKLGKLYYELKDYKKSESYYLRAYKRLNSVTNKYFLIDVLINMAELYEFKQKEETLYLYKEAMYYAENIDSRKKLCNIYDLISQYYERKKDYKNALTYFKKHTEANKELMKLNFKSKLEVFNIDIINIKDSSEFKNIRVRLEKEIRRQKNELETFKLSNKILEKKVYEDELTGIANRRSVNIYLEDMINRTYIADEKLVLFMIDIDNFKKYNDYWGHAEGDVCLKKVAASIKNIEVENNALFGRYGGEEFIYISIIKDYEEAMNLGERIRKEVEKLGLYYRYEDRKRKTTISVGGVFASISMFSSSREIIEMADRELYRAKDMGRNITLIKDNRKNTKD